MATSGLLTDWHLVLLHSPPSSLSFHLILDDLRKKRSSALRLGNRLKIKNTLSEFFILFAH